LGNRISQVVTTSDTKSYTWYVRDAQGNLLSTYTANGNSTDLADLEVNQSERFLYGSSRLGVLTASNSVDGGPDDMQYKEAANFGRGYKQYELTNHLGNVLVTISDRKFAVSSTSNSSLIDHYEPVILSAQDYYPFGMISRVALPNNGQTYRFGFNGKENDNGVKGLGNQQDYGMRIYDPRVGRFLSVDPLQTQFPWFTPYQFAGNTPIQAKDLDGLEQSYVYQDSKGQWRETPAGDNLARKNIPSGHEQFVRNSVSLPSQQQLKEQWATSLNFVPYVGEFKAAWESITGEEWFTGRKLSSLERKAGLLPIRMKGGTAVVKSELKQEVRSIAKEESLVAKSEAKAEMAHNGLPEASESNQAAANAKVNNNALGTGEYKDVGGHHVHAKAGFKDVLNYDPEKGFSISQDYMNSKNWNHQKMTNKQRELFKELKESGRPNTLQEHSRIAIESLKAGGATDMEARILVNQSEQNLKKQGVTAPSNIPWYKN
jgi:RHS repeat-associated protein